MSISNVKVGYLATKNQINPKECPVTIIGQLANLKKVNFSDVQPKFADHLNEKVIKQVLKKMMLQLKNNCRFGQMLSRNSVPDPDPTSFLST